MMTAADILPARQMTPAELDERDSARILDALRDIGELGMSSFRLSSQLVIKRSHVEHLVDKLAQAGQLHRRRDGLTTYYVIGPGTASAPEAPPAERITERYTAPPADVKQDVIQQPAAQDPAPEASKPRGHNPSGVSAERARQIAEENAKIKDLHDKLTVREMSVELGITEAVIYGRIAAMRRRGELTGEGSKVKSGRPRSAKSPASSPSADPSSTPAAVPIKEASLIKEDRAEEPKPARTGYVICPLCDVRREVQATPYTLKTHLQEHGIPLVEVQAYLERILGPSEHVQPADPEPEKVQESVEIAVSEPVREIIAAARGEKDKDKSSESREELSKKPKTPEASAAYAGVYTDVPTELPAAAPEVGDRYPAVPDGADNISEALERAVPSRTELKRLCDLAVAMEGLVRSAGYDLEVGISTADPDKITVWVKAEEGGQ